MGKRCSDFSSDFGRGSELSGAFAPQPIPPQPSPQPPPQPPDLPLPGPLPPPQPLPQLPMPFLRALGRLGSATPTARASYAAD